MPAVVRLHSRSPRAQGTDYRLDRILNVSHYNATTLDPNPSLSSSTEQFKTKSNIQISRTTKIKDDLLKSGGE